MKINLSYQVIIILGLWSVQGDNKQHPKLLVGSFRVHVMGEGYTGTIIFTNDTEVVAILNIPKPVYTALENPYYIRSVFMSITEV